MALSYLASVALLMAQATPPIMTDTFWTALGNSGPWAVVAGFLLWVVITAWKQDREKVIPFFGTLNETLLGLKLAVDANTQSNREILEELRRAKKD